MVFDIPLKALPFVVRDPSPSISRTEIIHRRTPFARGFIRALEEESCCCCSAPRLLIMSIELRVGMPTPGLFRAPPFSPRARRPGFFSSQTPRAVLVRPLSHRQKDCDCVPPGASGSALAPPAATSGAGRRAADHIPSSNRGIHHPVTYPGRGQVGGASPSAGAITPNHRPRTLSDQRYNVEKFRETLRGFDNSASLH
jgi:hypothetical protein